MLYPKIEECVEKVGNKYALTIISAKRGRDLAMKMPIEFANSRTKELTFALREIAEGQIVPHLVFTDSGVIGK